MQSVKTNKLFFSWTYMQIRYKYTRRLPMQGNSPFMLSETKDEAL